MPNLHKNSTFKQKAVNNWEGISGSVFITVFLRYVSSRTALEIPGRRS